jgi:hypothetical protein
MRKNITRTSWCSMCLQSCFTKNQNLVLKGTKFDLKKAFHETMRHLFHFFTDDTKICHLWNLVCTHRMSRWTREIFVWNFFDIFKICFRWQDHMHARSKMSFRSPRSQLCLTKYNTRYIMCSRYPNIAKWWDLTKKEWWYTAREGGWGRRRR